MINQPIPKGTPRQAVFATYHRINRDINYGKYKYEQGDLIVIKEKWRDEQGNIQRQIRTIENFERPFWITKKRYRKHKDKREWAPISEVDQFKSPQWNLSYAVQKALKDFNPDPKKQLRVVNRSPYVYGTDLSPTFFVKELYQHHFNDARIGACNVCWLDIETNVLGAEEEIILLSLVMNGTCIVYALKSFISKTTLDYERQFYEVYDELNKIIQENKIVKQNNLKYDIKLVVCETEVELIEKTFDTLHRWKPDYVSGWNIMLFDQDYIVRRMKHYKMDPALYFSDPEIPEKYKGFRFVEGRPFMVSDSGKKTNLRPIQRWHEIVAPASFQWVDAMSLYYQFRKHLGMESSYKLDYIMDKNIGMRKYEIPEAESKRGLDKHIFMQRHHPVHYAVYNAFDSIGLDIMDHKTGDIRNAFNIMLGNSDLKSYQSNPSKLEDAFHMHLFRKRGHVIGSTSDTMFNEWDAELPPLDGWITALPTVMLDDQEVGMCVVDELPDLPTKFSNHSGDCDIVSSYPLGGILNNISRFTTEIEVTGIEGMSMENRYRVGLNMMAGSVNSMSNSRIVHGLPDFVQLESQFDILLKQFRDSCHNCRDVNRNT